MPPIDHDYLAAQTGGDAALARELLTLLAEQCRHLLTGIADPDRSLSDRADLAHTLKGSALGVGAGAVARESGALEEAFRAGRAADPMPLAKAVAETLQAIARD